MKTQLETYIQGSHPIDLFLDQCLQKTLPNPGCDNLFLLTNGGRYTQVYRRIKEAIKANDIDTDVPTPSAFRIKVTSDPLKSGSSDVTRRKVNKHLSPSNHTAEMFYEFVDDRDPIAAYHEINRLEDM